MKLDAPAQISRLIDHFNNAENPLIQFALASALRDELENYTRTLDETILPRVRAAMIEIVKVDR